MALATIQEAKAEQAARQFYDQYRPKCMSRLQHDKEQDKFINEKAFIIARLPIKTGMKRDDEKQILSSMINAVKSNSCPDEMRPSIECVIGNIELFVSRLMSLAGVNKPELFNSKDNSIKLDETTKAIDYVRKIRKLNAQDSVSLLITRQLDELDRTLGCRAEMARFVENVKRSSAEYAPALCDDMVDAIIAWLNGVCGPWIVCPKERYAFIEKAKAIVIGEDPKNCNWDAFRKKYSRNRKRGSLNKQKRALMDELHRVQAIGASLRKLEAKIKMDC
jgi:hypothetical protein